jgi:branched-chain amino acid transport system ATP-binding protein
MSQKPYPIAISARGLTKSFRGFVAVNNVDLDVREGSIHALIGPNGAGKTTVFNLLTKFLMPTAGTLAYRGQDISHLSCVQIARLGIVRSFQISAVFHKLSVLQNVRVALQRQAGLARQFWLPESRLAALDARCEELLAKVGLADQQHVLAGELPYGRKRTLELATTLAMEPNVILLDEPMAGMAHEDIPSIARLIRTVSVGRTVLMVEHNLDVVADLCDRITVLQRGGILVEGSYEEISANAEVRRAYLGGGDA